MKFRSDLHAGRAGEHIVCADLLSQGHDCFHAAQGMPYDLVADVDGCLLLIQVKATRKPEILSGRRINNVAYRFWVTRCGKNGRGSRACDDVDIYAFVALDSREIGYLSARQAVKTLFVRPEALRGTYTDEVAAAKHKQVLDFLGAGASNAAAAEHFGISVDKVSKIKNGHTVGHVFGIYMKDLPFSSAVDAFVRGDTTPIGSKEYNAALRKNFATP